MPALPYADGGHPIFTRPQQRAAIKASTLHHRYPRPYGSFSLLPASLASPHLSLSLPCLLPPGAGALHRGLRMLQI